MAHFVRNPVVVISPRGPLAVLLLALALGSADRELTTARLAPWG
jgi:hypothetical protein